MNTLPISIRLLLILIVFPWAIKGQQARVLSLEEAREIVLSQNKLLRIQKEKANESSYKIKAMAAKGKPMLYASGNYLHSFNENNFVIPRGGVGDLLNIPIPWNDFTLYEGRQDIFTAGILAYQPLTQLFRVHHGIKAVRAEAKMENSKAKKAALEAQAGVEKLFYAIKIQEKKIAEAQAAVELAYARLYDAEIARIAGEIHEVNTLGLKAEKAGKEHDLLEAEIARENYLADLRNTLSMPDSISFELAPLPETSYVLQPETQYQEQALQNNPELQAAQHQLEKAGHGVMAAKNAYLPNLGITGGVTYQGIIKELPETNYFVGANLTWNFLDFGKRKSELQQNKSKQLQADLFAENTRNEIRNKIGKAHRNARQAERLLFAAHQAYGFREEEYRIKKDGLETGLITKKELLETKVELEKAAQNAYAAQLNYNLAILDLKVLAGIYP
ncbi:TolC family protein [Sinomicrobium pectinilyticum]|uniref:TolC family protein n=1 Tax=Sinomicrobium pectinilyticum TaxID=1084421 RepID=A0A3N0EEJ7_SINP1|nr:TolC family protein [Sinomicrobium pectinilyticum]RNL86292.1 TolC family protein [Sinomicrobium pectinilyticum]